MPMTEERSNYRTLIVIHGYGWSSGVFKKALPEGRRKGIRLIALNRRDFPGSTPYSQEELADLKSPKVDLTRFLVFLRKRSMEIIGFIHHITQKLGLPTTDPDGRGNISILGWSSGCIYLFSVMACFNEDNLPTPWKETIQECISSCILFDPPIEACGLRSTEQYSSWPEKLFVETSNAQDPSDPARYANATKAVNDWISGWYRYDHAPDAVNLDAFILANDNPIRPSTIQMISDSDRLLEASCPATFANENLIRSAISTGAFRITALYVLDKTRRQGAEDDKMETFFSGIGGEDILAEKRLSWLWCENSCWVCAYNPHAHRKDYGFRDGTDCKRKMINIPNANHFIQWEDPGRFIDYVLHLV